MVQCSPKRGARVKPGHDEGEVRALLSGVAGTSPATTSERVEYAQGSRTSRGASARVALHAGAVAHQREVAAFAAGFTPVALGARFGALLGRGMLGVGLGVGPVECIELLRRRELGLRLELERG